jgi:MoaA/NifB/PqqE/SkfB family radical SAM enzyme
MDMSRFIDLDRIEFVVTDACSGRCKHCSNGERNNTSGNVDADAAITVIRQASERFSIESVMTFGGEPLLHPETVYKIHDIAHRCGIPKRQLITNGFFSKDEVEINEVAKSLCYSGVNEILLSVDVFHQEFIPIEPVMQFAEALILNNAPSLRVQPAWVVSEISDNKYNTETKSLLKLFTDKGICVNEGNNISPSGNALKNLAEYFPPPEEIDWSSPCGSAPYTTRLDEISCIGINPTGNVSLCSIVIGNIYTAGIMDIVDSYDPYKNQETRAVLNGGVAELLQYAKSQSVSVDISDCRTACGVCHKVMASFRAR